VETLDPLILPLTNTLVLLTSGVTLTVAHHSMLLGRLGKVLVGIGLTILLGLVFSGLQGLEYM